MGISPSEALKMPMTLVTRLMDTHNSVKQKEKESMGNGSTAKHQMTYDEIKLKFDQKAIKQKEKKYHGK